MKLHGTYQGSLHINKSLHINHDYTKIPFNSLCNEICCSKFFFNLFRKPQQFGHALKLLYLKRGQCLVPRAPLCDNHVVRGLLYRSSYSCDHMPTSTNTTCITITQIRRETIIITVIYLALIDWRMERLVFVN